MDPASQIFVVPHFHYDVAWITTEKENLRRVYKILSKVIEIMKRDEDFKFLVDQGYYLEKVKQEKHELFNQLAERIQEGRIEVVNAGYVMPDLNLVSPLVIEKNYEIMNNFAKKEFHTRPQVAWMIDCFGHPGIMPKIARDAGLRYYVFWRGMIEPKCKQDFFWEGINGSRILVHWMKQSYSLFGSRFKKLDEAVQVLNPTTNIAAVPFGDDFFIPQEKLIQQVHKTKCAKFATPSEVFKEIEKHQDKLRTVKGEMLSNYANFRGYYSSRVSLKQLYRHAERNFLNSQNTEEEWKNLLYSTFHDLIGGTGIDKIYPTAKRKLRRLIGKEREVACGKLYPGKLRNMFSLELRAESGDLYHSKPSRFLATPPDSSIIKKCLQDSSLEISIQTNFQFPEHVLKLVVDTGVREGILTQYYWNQASTERKLDTLYALNGFFEYKNQDGTGFRFRSDDCFDYEVKRTGKVYLTLVRSVQILSHGDAGPRIRCPKAEELGKHRFEVSINPIGAQQIL